MTVPITFQTGAGRCFGWFHAARAPARGAGVLLCRPMGYEALCSYRTYTQLAHTLADAGFEVLRFDYHGTGDSAGGDHDPGRVPAWIDSIACAADELKRLGGVSHIALFGMRLGATLAVQAALRMGGVEDLVLWAPCATGRAFAREMRAANAQRATAAPNAHGELEALGCLYTAETLEQLNALDCVRPGRAPAQRVLIIGRDDMPAEGPLPASYRRMGVDTTYTVWPGYAGMMAEPHEAVLEPATVASITEWLTSRPAPSPAQARLAQTPDWPDGYTVDGLREEPLAFGADRSLFGILAEPTEAASPAHADTAILMLNVGGNYRIGPNRNYVKLSRALAASGYRTLRMDLAGIGDSRTEAGFSSRSMYRKRSIADVRAAIDCLAARGCKRFYLMGICSGSYVAFQTALADSRVNGQILMNSRLLEWQEDQEGTWQTSMQRYYKSTDFYRRALLRANLYRRLVRGEVDVNGIAGRIWTLLGARFKRAFREMLDGRVADEGVLAKMKQLSARGTDTLMIMSVQDDGLDYVEFHLGRRGSRLRRHPNFRMVMIEDADHTFSTVASQRAVIDAVREHLDLLHLASEQWAPLPGLIATT
ncbi:alpha/beta fold hydrolase [Caenimonas soli]|uniref:alpha/beta fold hydrolase n=1 Tax=Caenimonas soli TaxID=2735555 RepID=UPI001553FD37|nr:alpha/beta fold hydrolase [Caenimonas soli]NPC57364.1 alpha/beta fold hydrolase [Caenimonas soli]